MTQASDHVETIYDEARVPAYTLPEILIDAQDQPLVGPAQWFEKRRPELLALFATQVYGRTPLGLPTLTIKHIKTDVQALQGKAKRKEICLELEAHGQSKTLQLLLYLPHDRLAPIFCGLNFQGNASVHPDPAITVTALGTHERGTQASRWPLEMLLARGYGLATLHCADLMPDHPESFQDSVQSLYETSLKRSAETWGAIGMWAWGLCRAMDYFEQDPDVDHQRVALVGHSRLGKTALWAAAQDERFACVISNNSGCAGAALSKRCFGETIASINQRFPHWFCQNFHRYNQHEADLPLDQHMLLALIAPRPLYVASAAEDLWADPKGEFLASLEASKVYNFLNLDGLPCTTMPKLNQPCLGRLAYHRREGGHDITTFDWQQYLDFADRFLG